MKKIYLLLIIPFLFSANEAFSMAAPAGDDCSSAVDLAGQTSPISGTTIGAANDFSFCTMGSAADLIMYYDLPVGSTLTIQQTVNAYDSRHSLRYSGACPGTIEIDCTDDSDLSVETWQNCTGATQRVYWIQSGYSANEGTFTLAWSVTAGTCPVAPPNDECSGAISVTVNPDQLCGSVTAGTVFGTTQSPESTTSCGGTEDDDVWFSFVATGTLHTIDLLNVAGSTTDMYHSVWEGTCPGGLTLVAGTCSDPNAQIVTGLTPGNTYYIRVYTWTATGGQTSTFNVCVGTPPPPPANDDCGGAIALTVNSDQLCGTTTSSSVTSATASTQNTASCGGTEDDDVWFSFTATSSQHYIDLLNVAGSTTDLYHSVWEGTCPALTLVTGTCSDPNSQTVTGLTPGNTYFVRVYTWTSTTGQTSTFDLCIGSDAAPTCSDGIQNQGETGVDCGGPCPACPPPTCSDGIQNQGETGVDCGGPCPACPPIVVPTACTNATYNLTTLSSVSFYDDGGAGGTPCVDAAGGGNYSNANCFTTTTICAAPGEYIVADFREFAMWNTTSGWDWMKIYDNSAASGTVLYDNSSTGPNNPMGDCGIAANVLNYCSSGQCLTFEFWATSVVNRAGWDALVTSVILPCVVPLPVELTNFSGKSHTNYNLLEWNTETEINNDYYILERSDDGLEFEEIARLTGAGNSNRLLNYNYKHNFPKNIEYYRLKQVDFDGKFSFSKIIVIKSGNGAEITIYPNPSKNNLFFDLNESIDGKYTITYTSILGRTFKEELDISAETKKYKTNRFSDLASGVYFVQILNENDEVLKTQKIIKK